MYLLDTHNQRNELPTRGGDYQNFRKPREIKKHSQFNLFRVNFIILLDVP